MAIQLRVSCTEFEILQMAMHPFVTAAPAIYPIVKAVFDAASKI